MGCYVDKNGNPQDACVISKDYSKADTYYIFNHVDITITYHSGAKEDWGKFLLDSGETGGRIVGELSISFVSISDPKRNNLIIVLIITISVLH